VQELRAAFQEFRSNPRGAPMLAYAHAYGSLAGNGLLPYYLASAADQVMVSPAGSLAFSGFSQSGVFLKRFLASWGVRPLFFMREVRGGGGGWGRVGGGGGVGGAQGAVVVGAVCWMHVDWLECGSWSAMWGGGSGGAAMPPDPVGLIGGCGLCSCALRVMQEGLERRTTCRRG
jgi:hypothetical protein